jgi:ankyrin repeat protein
LRSKFTIMEKYDNRYYLKKAIELNNIKRVKKFLKNGFDVNQEITHNLYPLCIAIKSKNKEIILEIINAGASLKISHFHDKEDCFNELMIFICRSNDTSLLTMLLSKGFDPNYRMTESMSDDELRYFYPLNVVAIIGSTDLASIIINNGGDVHKSAAFRGYNSRIASSLTLAIENRRYEMVNFLLKNHSNPNPKLFNPEGIKTYLQSSLNFFDIKMSYLLVKHGAYEEFEFLENLLLSSDLTEQMKNDCKLLKIVLNKKFSPEIFQYYPKEIQVSIVSTFFALRIRYKKIKNELILYLINFMI